jgi:hypothetical protein
VIVAARLNNGGCIDINQDHMFFDMIIGMILGMVASPLMMKAIKSVKQRRKVSRMLREISELQKNGELSYRDQVL